MEHIRIAGPQIRGARWFKSSFSGGAGAECVEAAFLDDGRTAVRDSKDPDGIVLAFSAEAWGAFVRGVQSGDMSVYGDK